MAENKSWKNAKEALALAQERTAFDRNARQELQGILEHTLSFDDRLPWDQLKKSETYPAFSFRDIRRPIMPEEPRKFLLFATKKQRNLEALAQFREDQERYLFQKRQALSDYLQNRESFLGEVFAWNSQLSELRKYFEKGEKSAVEEYASLVLERSEYPKSFRRSWCVKFFFDEKTLVVHYLMPHIKEFPLAERYAYNEALDEIEKIFLPKEEICGLYRNTLLSVGLRTIHEMFESITLESVERVAVNGYVRNAPGIETPIEQELARGMSNNIRCVFAVMARRREFSDITLLGARPERILENMGMKSVGDFMDMTQVIAPFEGDDGL